MELDWIWKAILIVTIGVVLLRVSGRKSISQMTIAQTIIMISIGSLLIQPVSGKNLWTTFGVAGLLISTLVFIEFIQIKWDKAENFFSGKSKVVIENGQLRVQTLKKLRLPVDKLEMWLRQSGIDDMKKVQWATIEPSGQLGYILKPEHQPITKKEYHELELMVIGIAQKLNVQVNHHSKLAAHSPLFTEIESGQKSDDSGATNEIAPVVK
ncbi:DUF421 domain-containing protein [Jeotgalibacillus salarius]|uniref:DUF421 domain-containing protein n=1 Tax=Jeotgalibacillus salarius TaxID=546023 RepID=A0A4Y8LC38_9BACL|nr:DUF421 domain-containing protein [Jeotgalibacillus salarius]TFD99817.1 DUF421 domain-containing protein [Jeotgalibacillus salarius]